MSRLDCDGRVRVRDAYVRPIKESFEVEEVKQKLRLHGTRHRRATLDVSWQRLRAIAERSSTRRT